jgi:cytochrome c556
MNLEKDSGKLAQAAQSGNMDDIKAQFGATAKSCKAYHDKYRQ